ncbi:MAG: acetyl-CoA carboxylase biotin carboxyl carrier protein subunit [Bdellovibrionaceae bacterium]|nr:acetyl-CoA carboxylase biotin carboxyl carrier protein subunit [Pseudobdellovibrionaceae bacterium]MBX3033612.1 acetyl-CoA carboxylase biotin carboxyl carrier protein subunit [Pseudobdellovibrionaceae bacterium]
MYFEAEMKGQKYKVDVTEQRHLWKVSIQAEGKEWKHYDISKKDYKQAEEYISFLFSGQSYLIDVIGQDTEYTVFTRNSFRAIKIFNDEMLLHESLKKGGGFGGDAELKSGMPGKVIEIFVKPGDVVAANKPLLIMEAMKMENEMRSTRDVKIKDVCVKQGDSVESGAVLIKFEEP